MKLLLHFLFVAFFATTTLVLSSCGDSKKPDPAPAPTTGTLNGQITPANSVTSVTATSTSTPATTATATPNASGAYTFSTLAAGIYTLSFTPATGFAAPNNLNIVVVTAGGITTAPPVTTPRGGTVNGQITPANAISTVTAVSASNSNQIATATPSASGAYTFRLAAGTYTLRFTPATGFTAPPNQTIGVNDGGNTTPSPTRVTQSGGTATFSIDGTATPVDLVRADYVTRDLGLTLLLPNDRKVLLRVYPYDQTAVTGTFGGVSNAVLFYNENITITNYGWQSPITGTPTGSYTVTPAGTNPVRISGTFSCTLQDYTTGTAGTRVVSGTFANVAL
jgi:hypothetical protein